MSEVSEQSRRFNISGSLSVVAGEGGLTKIVIKASGASVGWTAKAEIYLNGATVTRYEVDGKPVLFCSRTSKFEVGKAIRGGVPIIFPWFGPHPTDPKMPQHGFVRAAEWKILNTARSSSGVATVVLGFEASEATRAIWPHDFALRYTVSLGRRLEMALEVTNRSNSEFRFDEALHTYLAVSDVRNIHITGLEQTEYADKVDGLARKRLDDAPLRLTGETDRVFLNTGAVCRLHDPARSEIAVGKEGSLSTVVWNPWDKAENLVDLAGNQWPGMVCIETVNTMENSITLMAGASHTMKSTLHLSSRGYRRAY